MIEGSVCVLGPAPAVHLDPFRLAAQQPGQTDGYIEIFYPGAAPEAHLLFLRGGKVCSAARLARNGRAVTGEESLRREFARREVEPAVSLHLIPTPVLGMVMAVFSYEPSLSVGLEQMPRAQMARLLERAWTPPCLVEITRWSTGCPELMVEYVGEPEGFARLRPRLSHGTLRLYEIMLNAEPQPGRAIAASVPVEQEQRLSQPVAPPSNTVSEQPLMHPIVAQAIEDLAKPLESAGTRHGGAVDVLAREFSLLAHRCLGSRSERILSQAAADVRKAYPEFNPPESNWQSLQALFMYIERSVERTLIGRGRFRAAAAPMLSEFYSTHHDELQREKLLRRAEELYRSITKGF